MDVSIFLAKLFGFYLVIIGFGLIVNRRDYHEILEGFTKNKALMLFSSVITLIMGLLLVLFHNVWVMDWPVLVTLLCWLTLVKGVIRLLIPNAVMAFALKLLKHNRLQVVLAVCICLGLFLLYCGYR